MFTFTLFVISGAIILTLTLSKRIEEKEKRTPIILRAISKGDESVRSLHHEALHQYTHGKDKFAFWFKKQLPLKLKGFWNRVKIYTRERSNEYMRDMRSSKLLKKSDGISEFFKSISEIEKGTGEINESWPTENEVVPITPSITPSQTIPSKVVKKKRVYKPRVKKLSVIEMPD